VTVVGPLFFDESRREGGGFWKFDPFNLVAVGQANAYILEIIVVAALAAKMANFACRIPRVLSPKNPHQNRPKVEVNLALGNLNLLILTDGADPQKRMEPRCRDRRGSKQSHIQQEL
jgi:hypothetical protein